MARKTKYVALTAAQRLALFGVVSEMSEEISAAMSILADNCVTSSYKQSCVDLVSYGADKVSVVDVIGRTDEDLIKRYSLNVNQLEASV